MDRSLSSLVDNLSGGLHREKCADCKSHLDYMSIKDDKLIFRCFGCKKKYEKEFNKELIKRFKNTYKFCDKDINKFILLLRKGVYLYEYMDNWERFNETLLPNKEAFFSNLNMENITDTECKKLVCNLYDKKNYLVDIRTLKQALNHGLILKKFHKVIQFYQEAWLKPYIDMNTELRKKAKNNFEKDFFKLMNNAVYGKTWKM